MTYVKLNYLGKLAVVARHENGAELPLDGPKSIGGEGKEFSPTDLVGTALVSCILITMAKKGATLGIDLGGMSGGVEKVMGDGPVRRIGKLRVEIRCPKEVGKEARAKLEKAGLECPVHGSLHPDVALEISFVWGL